MLGYQYLTFKRNKVYTNVFFFLKIMSDSIKSLDKSNFDRQNKKKITTNTLDILKILKRHYISLNFFLMCTV